jgi:hypothetical protein
LLLAFVPALIASGWVIIAGQPHPNWFQQHVSAWSTEIGIGGIVEQLLPLSPVLAFGLGLLLAASVEPSRPHVAPLDLLRPLSVDHGEPVESEAEESSTARRRAA